MSRVFSIMLSRADGFRAMVIGALCRWIDDHLFSLLITMLTLIIVLVTLWPLSVVRIDPGNTGVLWKRFNGGTDMNTTYKEGTHLIYPWDVMYIWNTRYTNLKRNFQMFLPDQLTIHMDVSLIYRASPESVNILNRFHGKSYEDEFLVPLMYREASNALEETHDLTTLSQNRETVELKILDKMQRDMLDAHKDDGYLRNKFILNKVVISNIEIPEDVKKSILEKNAERQLSETYQLRIKNEGLEAQRKVIEAQGIRSFQQTIGDGRFESYLKMKAIDATLSLARSTNSKVVIFGTKPWGLPIFLDGATGTGVPAGASASPALPGEPQKPASTTGLTDPPPVSAPAGPDASGRAAPN